MDNDDTSNPSNKSDSSDDLIEELARLMASDAKGTAPDQAKGGAQDNGGATGGDGGTSGATSGSGSSDRDATRPADAPEPRVSSSDAPRSAASSPGWLPTPRKPAERQEPSSQEPSFEEQGPPSPEGRPPRASEPDVAQSRTAGAPPPESTPDQPQPEPFRFRFGQPESETDQTDQTDAEPGGQATAAPGVDKSAGAEEPPAGYRDFDFGFSSRQKPPTAPEPGNADTQASTTSSAELDPIADLIRGDTAEHGAETPQVETDRDHGEPVGAEGHGPEATEPETGPSQRDSFNVPPVFGLGGQSEQSAGRAQEPARETPTPPEHQRSMSGSDALDDIENLIGSAAHVSVSDDASARSAIEQPVSRQAEPGRPAGRQTPAPETSRSNGAGRADNQGVDAAETAILAAMSGSGQRVQQPEPTTEPSFADQGHSLVEGADDGTEPGYADETFADEDDGRIEERRGGIGWKRIAAPAIALLLLGGVGYAGYSVLTSAPSDGEAPVLVADSEPARETPEPEEPANDSGQSVVFGENGGSNGDDEQLVSRDQSQQGVDAGNGSGDTTGSAGAGDGASPNGQTASGGPNATGGQSASGGEDDAIRQIITADTSENGLANRKVRTVTVRPDGTIVRGDDQVAGGEALPVDRPEVPELPEDAVQSDLSDTTVANLVGDQTATSSETPQLQSSGADLVSVDDESVPFPASRPSNLSSLRSAAPSNGQSAQSPGGNNGSPANQSASPSTSEGAVDLLGSTANASQATAQPAVVTSSQPSAPSQSATVEEPAAWVQLSSQREQAVADEVAGNLSNQYASALGGRNLTVQRADLGDRGIWYRVLVPARSLSEAQNVCVQIQNAGGDCFPRPN